MAGALAHLLLIQDEGRGVAGVRLEGWLRWSAHPTVVLGQGTYPAFAPRSSQVAFGFLFFLYPVIQNLPQLPMHVVIFRP